MVLSILEMCNVPSSKKKHESDQAPDYFSKLASATWRKVVGYVEDNSVT